MDTEFYRRFGALEATVYHGTRQSLAAAILRYGFRPAPVDEQVAQVAEVYGVPLSELQAYMWRTNRFTTLDCRTGTVSTTADSYRASGWANRAPEATGEVLRSVYVLTHPESGDGHGVSDEADFWVMAQQLGDPPVVIEARAPMAALQSWDFSPGPTAPQMLRDMLDGGSTFEDFLNLYRLISEWRIRVEDIEFIDVNLVPTRVFLGQLAYLSECSVVELHDQVRADMWGEAGDQGDSDTPWWPFDQVWGRLTPQRRAQLEEIAGRSLS